MDVLIPLHKIQSWFITRIQH